MKRRFQRGLVVGKFSPLHRGHERVIHRALEDCREVILISYSKPEFPGCEAERRERWLAELFPDTQRLVVTDERLRRWRASEAEVPEVPANDQDDFPHRRFVGWLCHRVLGEPVDAVFTSEDYGDGFAAELTAYFREHGLSSEPVRHVLVDRARAEVPVSGTVIRADVHAHRAWLAPGVYASFVRRVALLGGESSGKSTLAESLARELNTLQVAEYGRELWEQQQGALRYEDLLRIAVEQVAREEAALRRACRYLVCDTTPLTTLFYCHHLFGRAEPALVELAARPYDFHFLCAPDFPFVQDGTRQVAAFRDRQHAWYVEQLAARRVRYELLSGSHAERTAHVRKAVASNSL